MQLNFRDVTLADKTFIDSYLKPYNAENSEFSFVYLMMWGQGNQIQLAEYENTLYFLLRFPNFPPFMFAPIPREAPIDYGKQISVAESVFESIGAKPYFRSICGVFRDWFERDGKQYELHYDRNTADYVYRTTDLIDLKGKKYHGKRNHINRFLSSYELEYRSLTVDDMQECMTVYENWLNEKDKQVPGIVGETQAIRYLIENFAFLPIRGGGIWIDEKLVAFALGELIRPDMMVLHVEKANASINGLYAMINQQFAANECQGVEWINREEDMGLEGLRKAKLSYHPSRLVEKYIALPR